VGNRTSKTSANGLTRVKYVYDPATDTTEIVNHLRYGSFGQILGQTDADFEPAFTYTAPNTTPTPAFTTTAPADTMPSNGRFINEDPLGFAAGDANLSRQRTTPTPTGC
jgi:hypothetical protein